MLKRFLRSIGIAPEEASERPPTHAERLLESVRVRVGADLAATPATAPLSALLDRLLEIEAEDGLPAISDNDPARREQFARSWLTLLLDNDALAPGLQLSARELRKPRALLEGFFLGSTDVQAEAHGVLQLIEAKFSGTAFSQAALLLQLFDTEPATRRNNESNLFFEQMILRLLAARQRSVGGARSEEFLRVHVESLAAPGEGLVLLGAWLATQCNIRLHTHTRCPAEVRAWEETLAPADPSARSALLRIVPPARWRPIAEQADRGVAQQIGEQLRIVPLRAHLIRGLGAIYFVVRATGRIGFEETVFQWLDWVDRNFDTIPARILPDLHRLVTIDDHSIEDAFGIVHDRYLRDPDFGTGSFSPEAIADAVERVHRKFSTLRLGDLPEGDYDLGGVVLDELLEFPHASLAHALRTHRLT